MVRVIDGFNTIINCTAIGNPLPNTYWYDGNKTISNQTLILNATGKASALQNFTCVSVNAFGVDTETIVVNFISELNVEKIFNQRESSK